MAASIFYDQSLQLINSSFRIELKYENELSEDKQISKEAYHQRIEISDSEGSNLGIRVFKDNKEINSGLITGIQGGLWLFQATEKDKAQSIKLKDGNLILSLGFHFLSIQIQTLELNWAIKPDSAEIFEFYDLKDDFLLRGELQIHRIDLNGQIKWSYGGRDIWVNIDGKQEISILENEINLIDFDHNEYTIDFEGNTLKDNPSERTPTSHKKKKNSSWWKFWERR
jgi:hypothetical protein